MRIIVSSQKLAGNAEGGKRPTAGDEGCEVRAQNLAPLLHPEGGRCATGGVPPFIEKLRIVHALEGHSWSGGQQQALFLARGQSKRGHQVRLMSQMGSELSTKAIDAGLDVRPHDYRREVDPVSIYRLVKAFREFNPDIVNVHRAWAHTQWAVAALIVRFRGLIVTRRVLFRPDFNPVSLVKYRSAAIRGYIAVSQAVRDRLGELGIPPRKIAVVYPATDTDRFDPDRVSLPKEFSRQNFPGLKILSVANYHPNKGHHVLLEAFQEVNKHRADVWLFLAGLNTDSGECLRAIQNHPGKDRIVPLGFRSDIPELMRSVDFFVNPSFQEGFPGTVREALAMKLPVILSDIPAHRELGTMIPSSFFSSGSAKELAQKLLLLFEERIPSPNYRELAVKNFSVDSMVDQTLQVYQKFLFNSSEGSERPFETCGSNTNHES